MANWYTSTFPNSHFRHQLYVAIASENKRYGLRNNHLSIYHTSGKTEKKELTTTEEIMDVLENIFKLKLNHLPGLEERLNGLIPNKK